MSKKTINITNGSNGMFYCSLFAFHATVWSKFMLRPNDRRITAVLIMYVVTANTVRVAELLTLNVPDILKANYV